MQKPMNKTHALQTDLGLYCRTGINEPETTIQENTFHYRRLVFNVIKDSLKTAFPITRTLIGKKRWKKMVKHFFENHACQTAQIWKLPFEFYEFYSLNDPSDSEQAKQFPFKKDFLFIKELLYFEWLEIEVFMMEDLPINFFKMEGDLKKDILIPNPEIKILPLEYPIHVKKTREITAQDKGQYFVTLHRDYYDKQVKFNDFSYPFIEMLLLINEQETTFSDLNALFSKYETDTVKNEQSTAEFISFALQNNLILGFK